MKTETTALDASTPTKGNRRFSTILLSVIFPCFAVMTLPCAGTAGNPVFGDVMALLNHFCWLLRIWTPFIFAIMGILACRSVWWNSPKEWITGLLLAIPFLIDASVILLYIYSQFAFVYHTCSI